MARSLQLAKALDLRMKKKLGILSLPRMHVPDVRAYVPHAATYSISMYLAIAIVAKTDS